PESDVYSLACMVYEMLAGQPPFSGPTAMALLARHSLDNVPSLKIVRGTVPDAVEDAIVRAMAKVPADRFRSAMDFANALTDNEGAALRRLHVTSRNGVMPYKGKAIAPDSIAKALSVGTIVSGTIDARGDKIRVTVDMLDARTGNSIGSTEIEKTKQDAFALQDTLVTEVSAVLRKQLGQQVQVLTSKAGTSNAAAWEGFQRAKQM